MMYVRYDVCYFKYCIDWYGKFCTYPNAWHFRFVISFPLSSRIVLKDHVPLNVSHCFSDTADHVEIFFTSFTSICISIIALCNRINSLMCFESIALQFSPSLHFAIQKLNRERDGHVASA